MKLAKQLEKGLKGVAKMNSLDLLILSLLSYVVIMGVRLPLVVAEMLDTIIGKVVLVMLALLLFLRSPLLGVMAMIAVFELIRRAEHVTGTSQMRLFLPTDEHRGEFYTAMNQFPVTVEEEVIAKMIPRVSEYPMHIATFKPSKTDIGQASPVRA